MIITETNKAPWNGKSVLEKQTLNHGDTSCLYFAVDNENTSVGLLSLYATLTSSYKTL